MPEVKPMIIDMSLNASGVRDTARSLPICPNTVLRAFRKCNFSDSLLLDSRVLRDQELNERRKQRFASLADVVHKLEETQGEREFLL